MAGQGLAEELPCLSVVNSDHSVLCGRRFTSRGYVLLAIRYSEGDGLDWYVRVDRTLVKEGHSTS